MSSDRSFLSYGKLFLLGVFYLVLPVLQAVLSAVVWGAFLYFVVIPAWRDYFWPMIRPLIY